jgi:diguanylate cyclase (GGDEF)-like protein
MPKQDKKGKMHRQNMNLKASEKMEHHIDVEVSVNTIFYKGEKAILAYLRDNTERKLAEENLKYLSIHDSLTGLHNRFLFEEELRRLSAGRFDPIGIVMCDLDGLKLVNDNLGHTIGDRQLVAAANLLKEQFRTSDIVARIGGDEFAVLLPDCSLEILEDICNRLKQAMMNRFIPHTKIPLMMSIGYAIRNRKERPIEELLKEADMNMYKEKTQNSRLFRDYFNDIAPHSFSV